ncbi:hypothetical protein BDQ17DRAFT_1425280 [Cyathus striatus]|nr:hypothetical protein BDQ17DRAFT_1425280 [Cyathus striatus]
MPSPALPAPMHVQSGRTGQVREQRRGAAHPYKRKQSAGLQIIPQTGQQMGRAPQPQSGPMRPHSQFIPGIWPSTSGGSSMQSQSPIAPSPTSQMGIESAVQSPAYHTSAISAHSPPVERIPEPRRPVYTMRCDADYDHETRRAKILMELPGIKKSDISIKLTTCMFNRVRQVTVRGRSEPSFSTPTTADGMIRLRERKHGYFVRTFAVPADIKVRILSFYFIPGRFLAS